MKLLLAITVLALSVTISAHAFMQKSEKMNNPLDIQTSIKTAGGGESPGG